ncbi:MAG TPA: hypothetical protein VK633_05235, partial [Verrucomicrobiae bacterium]|nr:hypothetical protein [Verrucomicrobiae bacterium]
MLNLFKRTLRGFCAATVFISAGLTALSQEPVASLNDFWRTIEPLNPTAHPVQVQFTVNYYDASWKVLWVQEKETALYLEAGDKPLPFKSGDRVEVRGFTVPGKGNVDWSRSVATVLQEQAWNEPLLITNSATERLPSLPLFLELTGYIAEFQKRDENHYDTILRTAENEFQLFVQVKPGETLPSFKNAAVRVRGTAASSRDPSGRIQRASFWVPGLKDIQFIGFVHENSAFQRPVSTISALRSLPTNEWARVKGTVKSAVRGKPVMVADETGLLSFESWQAGFLEGGQSLEIVGFPSVVGTSIELRQALHRRADGVSELPNGDLNLASDIRDLPRDEAAKGLPVNIRGVVTWSEPGHGYLFLQDSSGGICVQLQASAKKPPEIGREIELRGKTAEGQFAPL